MSAATQGWVAAALVVVAGLLVPTALVIGLGGGAARVLYPGYVLAFALWLSTRHRPLYLAYVLATFAFSPFLRRLADYGAGFSPLNLILIAPYAGLLPTLPSLLHVMSHSRSPLRWPALAITACVGYAALLALYQGTILPTAYDALRWLMPTALCCFIVARPDQGEQAKRCFVAALCAIIPILTAYGIYQFLRAPLWDIYWMWNIDNPTFGEPAAYRIRVFSMMNSPGTVGMFAAYAMLILAGESPACMLIAAMGLPLLGLTVIRTAWLALVAGLAVILARAHPTQRATLIGGCAALGFAGGLVFASPALPPEIHNLISDRVATFSSLGSDTSTYDRLRVYDAFYGRLADRPWGEGFGANESTASKNQRHRSTAAIDSGILETLLIYGVFGGALYFLAFGNVLLTAWHAANALRGSFTGSLAAGFAVVTILPLGSNQVGEQGIVLWAGLGILIACAQRRHLGDPARTSVTRTPSRAGFIDRSRCWTG